MEVLEHSMENIWGEVFGKLNLPQSLANVNKPVSIGLGGYDYLVAPDSFDKSSVEWNNEGK